jgi:signal transduction histidine kinase
VRIPYTLRIVITWLRHIFSRELHSLRGRLLYTLLGLLTVLLCVELWQHGMRLERRQSLLRQGHARAAHATASTFRRSLDQLYRSQQVIGRTVLTGRMPAEQVQPYLEDVLAEYQGAASVQIIAIDGTIRYSAPPVGYQNSAASQPLVKALTPHSRYYLSNLYRPDSPDQQAPTQNQTARVRIASLIVTADGNPSGIVSMELYDYALFEFLSRWSNGQTEVLLDGEGAVAYSTRGETVLRAVEKDPEFAASARKHQEAPVDVELPNHEELMGYAAPIQETRWTVVYLWPENESLSAAERDTQTSVFVMVFVVLALGGAILAVIWVSLRPLVRLSAAIRMLGNLDLGFRLPRAEVQEFEPLVESFNRMAGELEKAHGELTDANRLLEQRVSERTRQLEEEHHKVLRAERLSSLGLLSSAIAHDLRSPLNTVALNVHWLRAKLGASMDERMDGKLAVIERELRRSDRIIRTLLAFARTGEPEREPTDLNGLVEEVVASNPPPPGITFDVRLSDPSPTAPVDPTQLFQVLENLIKNAFQAIPEGGRVRIVTELTPDACRISVSDTGPGIPPELHATIFEPLVTTKSAGTGIGLALSKRIVEAHRGNISVVNAPEGGATFRVELPLDTAVALPDFEEKLAAPAA